MRKTGLQPVFEGQTFDVGEVFSIVGDENGIVRYGDSPNQHINLARGATFTL